MAEPKLKEDKSKVTSALAKSGDGTIQITFTIPFTDIQKAKGQAAKELAGETEVPGFRKGMAPVDKVLEHISPNSLLEKSLSKILPGLVSEAIEKHKLKIAIYPKFELVSAQENSDWQIRAVTCELPEISLGNYKKALASNKAVSSIWTPGKDKKEKAKEPSREDREQQAIKVLLEEVKPTISKVLIEEEVNSRLSKLLERLEKLGLSLDSYLASVGKTAQTLREEYEIQAKSAIAVDLILTKIADEENLKVDKEDIDQAVGAANADKELASQLDTPERRKFIEVILKRRKALDYITSLV